jgi:uncharacterized membrane protein
MKNIKKIITTLVALPLVSADAGDSYGCFGAGMMSGTYGYFGGIFGVTISILAIVALVLLIIWLIKQIQSNTSSKKKKQNGGKINEKSKNRN